VNYIKDKRTILIVDDEEELRTVLLVFFVDNGFNVLTAGSGADAIALLIHHEVDVILSDLRMPNGTGLDLINHLKQYVTEPPPVILMSGFPDPSVGDLLRMGAYAVHGKPFPMEVVLQSVLASLSSSTGRTRRRHPRIGVNLNAAIQTTSDGPAQRGRVLNLSDGGMFIVLPQFSPTLGDRIQFKVEVPFPMQHQIEGVGIVRWIYDKEAPSTVPGFGIEFLPLQSPSNEHLERLLRSLKGDTAEDSEERGLRRTKHRTGN
jgi:CheY-like chemotaxis protein